MGYEPSIQCITAERASVQLEGARGLEQWRRCGRCRSRCGEGRYDTFVLQPFHDSSSLLMSYPKPWRANGPSIKENGATQPCPRAVTGLACAPAPRLSLLPAPHRLQREGQRLHTHTV